MPQASWIPQAEAVAFASNQLVLRRSWKMKTCGPARIQEHCWPVFRRAILEVTWLLIVSAQCARASTEGIKRGTASAVSFCVSFPIVALRNSGCQCNLQVWTARHTLCAPTATIVSAGMHGSGSS
eukprot:1160857-Pelagomonas_calceolata.AAC.6